MTISAAMKSFLTPVTSSVMIGNSLYSLYVINEACIIEFDLGRQRLGLIEPVPDVNAHDDTVFTVMPAEGGGLGLIIVSDFHAQLWKRKFGDHDDALWVLGRTVELDKLLPLGARARGNPQL